ncbi:MAG TPA: TatD family hydrolase [Candidatus Deferrimicrobiaceae bacterium]|jgi:TatD DNase family protein|nr:TatD family hydrolase [Candidatus Deferrimicrobiaceae bacterium]
MIIDSHCHLHDPAFADVRGAIIRATEHDVWGAVAVGCDLATNERTLRAAAENPKAVWPALGFHPEWTLTREDLEAVEEQIRASHARLIAIGEVGLPWYGLGAAVDAPRVRREARERLERLVGLAVRLDLPVILHAPHGSAADALAVLKRRGAERAVFHWHKAPEDVTREIVDAGYLVSVTPDVVYRDRDRELVERVPLESLLVESDAPWQYQGEFENVTSGPWLVARVAEEVAKIKRLPVDEAMYQLTVNTCRVFDIVWA